MRYLVTFKDSNDTPRVWGIANTLEDAVNQATIERSEYLKGRPDVIMQRNYTVVSMSN